ncbi:roadblock/LC7 domain-containing protein [Streptomyces aidingensis]|uniref:Predicted regulator of Ras-like GTPase activity, Roadblock/LC7/MglB family n=1 Tax=Streptomyces aidingensis TaxID=910347 RepID=A0A1I1KHW6_9ACTN|nr:roadblock/LC7 domain-containing protein [Streptomyces aidingensis]SFC57020.1 Predicted regulator of Ras-like GTPase activity, Roadblock/LC7/MglB family [Streptomyces aidingensis]
MDDDAITALLHDRVGTLRGVWGVLAFTADGMTLAFAGMGPDDARDLAALGAALGSVSDRLIARSQAGPPTTSVLLAEDGSVLLTRAGANSYLAAFTYRECAAGVIGEQLARLGTELGPRLEERIGSHLLAPLRGRTPRKPGVLR